MRLMFAWFSRSLRFLPALLTLGFLLVGCSSVSSTPGASTATSVPTLSQVHAVSTAVTRMYLGAVNGTKALIGMVLDGAHARAYVCDGTPGRLATLTEWFAGPVRSGRLDVGNQDQAHLSAQLMQQSATGMLTSATGRTFTFTISRVTATTQVGVFEGMDLIHGKRYHAGWIVLPNGDQRGAAAYPTGPVRGGIVIVLVPAYPTGPIRGSVVGLLSS